MFARADWFLGWLASLESIMILSDFCGSFLLALASFIEPVDPLTCGQACCYLLLTRLQVPVAMSDLDRDFGDLKRESSFRELQIVLKRYGTETSAWKLNGDEFCSIRGPFIAHIDDPKTHFRHYHVAEWRGAELVMLDPLAAKPISIKTDLELDAYRKAISGYVLVPNAGIPYSWQWQTLLSTAPIILVAGAAIFLWLLCRRAMKTRSDV